MISRFGKQKWSGKEGNCWMGRADGIDWCL